MRPHSIPTAKTRVARMTFKIERYYTQTQIRLDWIGLRITNHTISKLYGVHDPQHHQSEHQPVPI